MTLISVSSDPEELLVGRCLKEDCPVIVMAPSEWQLNRGIARHFHSSHPDQIEKVNPSVRSLGKKCTYLNTNQEARERTLFRKINRLNGKRRPCRCPVKVINAYCSYYSRLVNSEASANVYVSNRYF